MDDNQIREAVNKFEMELRNRWSKLLPVSLPEPPPPPAPGQPFSWHPYIMYVLNGIMALLLALAANYGYELRNTSKDNGEKIKYVSEQADGIGAKVDATEKKAEIAVQTVEANHVEIKKEIAKGRPLFPPNTPKE